MLLTGTATVVEARQLLKAYCEDTRSACISDLHALDYDDCEAITVMETIATEILNLGCDYDSNVKVLLRTGLTTVAEAKRSS